MLDKENYLEVSELVHRWIQSYFDKMESLPVKSQVKPGEIYKQIPPEMPIVGESLESIMQDLDDVILPGITHWQHPNFHAYFPANNSVESVLAENITSAIAAQCMIWETSPAATELEERMMEWLRISMQLPSSWTGVIQDSASISSLVAILCAREVATEFQSNDYGVPNHLRIYCSHQTHSSVEKGVGIAGIGRKNLVKIDVNKDQSINLEAFEDAVKIDISNGLRPCCAIAAWGTTGTVAIDNLDAMANICNRYNIWLHVDAAYAGVALMLPEYQWMLKGIEKADSFVTNPHKWLFTNFDCCSYFVKDSKVLIKTFEILPEYLKTRTRGTVNDYRDWGIQLGRRFRALKLWFVMRSYGLQGMQDRLRQHIKLSEYFADQIGAFAYIEIMAKPFMALTIFRFKPVGKTLSLGDLNTLNEKLLNKINRSGKAYMTHTKIDNKYVIRVVTAQTYIEQKHVDNVIELIKEVGEGLCEKESWA